MSWIRVWPGCGWDIPCWGRASTYLVGALDPGGRATVTDPIESCDGPMTKSWELVTLGDLDDRALPPLSCFPAPGWNSTASCNRRSMAKLGRTGVGSLHPWSMKWSSSKCLGSWINVRENKSTISGIFSFLYVVSTRIEHCRMCHEQKSGRKFETEPGVPCISSRRHHTVW